MWLSGESGPLISVGLHKLGYNSANCLNLKIKNDGVLSCVLISKAMQSYGLSD